MVILTIILCVFFSPQAAYSQTEAATQKIEQKPEIVTIVADVWCPYNCQPDSYNPGFMIEIVREIFSAHNIEVHYTNMPWGRAISETRRGNYNAIIGATRNDASDFTFPAEPQGLSKNGMYVRSGETWQYRGLDSLKHKIVGVIENYDYGGEFMKYIKKYRSDNTRIQLVTGDNALELNLRKLINRRIDVIAEDESVMSGALQRLGLQDQVIFAGDTEDISADAAYTYIAFSPKVAKSAEYAKIIEEGTIKLRETGKLKQILDRYHIKDWKQPTITKNAE